MKRKVLRKQNNARHCFICGVDNCAGLHANFYELEGGILAALVTVGSIHQSYPGRVHGGVSTALLDETIGRAINISEPDTWGVTVEIQTRYKLPVPYDVPLIVTGRITENNRKLFCGEGKILLPNGRAAVLATAKYMKCKLSDIADFESGGDAWAQRLSPGDPAEIDLPGE